LTLPVSAINALAREDPAAVTRLTQAAERVRVAQMGGRASDLPSATAAYRTALSETEERVVARLQATGRRVTAALRTRIRQSLAAAAADPSDRTALRQGRLSRELAPAGFDVFDPTTTRTLRLVPKVRSGAPAPPASARSPRDPGDEDAGRRRAQAKIRLETAVATARANLRRLETRASGLEKAAARHAQAAAAVRQRADAARQAAEEAKEAVRQAQRQLASAEEALRAAQAPP
jgi:hypothetical protein